MARHELLPLVDRILDGQLEAYLRTKRAEEGESYLTIAVDLRVEHQVSVSPETVSTWCERFGIEKAS